MNKENDENHDNRGEFGVPKSQTKPPSGTALVQSDM